MLPPETMQTTFLAPASRLESAVATDSAPAPSAITRARSAIRRTAAATSSSGSANAASSSCDACSQTRGISSRLPEPSTNDGVYSTAVGVPAASVAATGAPVSGSAAKNFTSGRSALTALAIPVSRPPPPYGHDDRVEAVELLEQLEADRAVPRHHAVVVDRMDEQPADALVAAGRRAPATTPRTAP